MNGIGNMGDWVDSGLCAQTGIDDETWFPSKGQSPRVAKSICVKCPVVAECLAWALANHEDGVWGATTSEDRKHMRAGRTAPRPHLCAECGRTFQAKPDLKQHGRTHEKRCRNGHDLTLPDAIYNHKGRRHCRACQMAREGEAA